MKRHVLTFAIAALVGSTVSNAQSAPDPRPGATTPVQVMNPTSNPVPVTGSLELTGNAKVTVTNTDANPLPVEALNLDDSVLNAFQTRMLFAGGNTQSDKEFTVPAGKRLVIESISLEAKINKGEHPEVFLTLTSGGKFSIHFLPVSFAGSDNSSLPKDYYMGLHATRFFADGGTKVGVVGRPIYTTSGVNTSEIDMSISGHLVQMP